MLIAVAGSSGLGPVAGVSTTEPTGLLQVVAAAPAKHVVLVAPRYASSMARGQAHVTIAARPNIRISVLPMDHHALTLTLISSAVLQLERIPGGWTDPGEAVQLLKQSAARSRSLIWYPRVFGLRDPSPTWNQRTRSLFSPFGYLTELGPAAHLEPGGVGLSCRSDETWFASGEVPRRFHTQPAAAAPSIVPLRSDPRAPYATRASVELTAFVGPTRRPITTALCSACSVGRTGAGCTFCGDGPRPGWTTPQATAERHGKQPVFGGGTR